MGIVFLVILALLSVGVYLANRKAIKMGLGDHPTNNAFLNATTNLILINLIFIVFTMLGA